MDVLIMSINIKMQHWTHLTLNDDQLPQPKAAAIIQTQREMSPQHKLVPHTVLDQHHTWKDRPTHTDHRQVILHSGSNIHELHNTVGHTKAQHTHLIIIKANINSDVIHVHTELCNQVHVEQQWVMRSARMGQEGSIWPRNVQNSAELFQFSK